MTGLHILQIMLNGDDPFLRKAELPEHVRPVWFSLGDEGGIITGDLSAVKAAVETAVTTYEDKCIDSFVLGNPHESIFPAIYGTTQVEEISALGILETYDAASIIEAADQAAKTAIVDLIELRIAKGMCGKSYMMITGEVSAVEASIQRAKELVAEKGMYLDSSVIAHPDRRMIDSIL